MTPSLKSLPVGHHDMSAIKNGISEKKETETCWGRCILGKGVSKVDQKTQKELFREEKVTKKVVQFQNGISEK